MQLLPFLEVMEVDRNSFCQDSLSTLNSSHVFTAHFSSEISTERKAQKSRSNRVDEI